MVLDSVRALVFPSSEKCCLKKTLEGSIGPTLVVGSSFTAVSSRPLLVDGSGSSSQGSSLCDGSSGTVCFPTRPFMVQVLIWGTLSSWECGLHRSRGFISTTWR
ncbi:hypothetical protein E2C01_005814 [Portunus trituberculatus]|uniref:Uncharacterized protein n=1 Tax=Portunus trituberculatus TaxID=210409 RepID=A0A5B7CWG6_PORTR|nr:hypothetical protein [Portunus trituberculatus]